MNPSPKRHVLWSMLERLAARSSTSIVQIVFAAVAVPEIVGLYSIAILFLMFTQMVLESTVRQFSVLLVLSSQGRRWLRILQLGYAAIGSILVLGGVYWAHLAAQDNAQGFTWSLLPLALVPLVNSASLHLLAIIQLNNGWRTIARIQTTSAFASLAICVPLTMALKSPLGPSLSALIAEVVALILFAKSAKKVPSLVLQDTPSLSRSEIVHTTFASLLVWAELSFDRMLIAIVGGPTAIATYTFALSLSRSVAEAISFAGANVLRPRLALRTSNAHDAAVVQEIWNHSKYQLLASSIAILLFSQTLLPLMLGEDWNIAVSLIPLLLAGTPLTFMTSQIGVLLVVHQKNRRALPIRVLGISLALLIAALASFSLVLAAIAYLLRQTVSLLLMRRIVQEAISLRLLLEVATHTALLLTLALLTTLIIK